MQFMIFFLDNQGKLCFYRPSIYGEVYKAGRRDGNENNIQQLVLVLLLLRTGLPDA